MYYSDWQKCYFRPLLRIQGTKPSAQKQRNATNTAPWQFGHFNILSQCMGNSNQEKELSIVMMERRQQHWHQVTSNWKRYDMIRKGRVKRVKMKTKHSFSFRIICRFLLNISRCTGGYWSSAASSFPLSPTVWPYAPIWQSPRESEATG